MSSFTDDVIQLKNAGTWSGGGTPSKANPDFWDNGDIPWVSPKDMKTFELHDSQDKITAKAVEASPVKLVPAGSVLMVVRSGILAHTFPVAIAKTAVTLNQDMKAITPNPGLSPEFLAYQLRAQGPEILKTCTKSGTTVASVETKQLQALPIWVPEAETQFKVVEDLDTQLSRLEETVTTLQGIQAKLKQARASILKAAVEGRLVETEAEISKRTGSLYEDAAELLIRALAERKRQFQEAQTKTQRQKKWKEPCIPQLHEEFSVPEGWAIASMDQIAHVSGGLAKDSKITSGEPLPYLRVANVQRGKLELEDVKTIICPTDRIDDLLLKKGDVLLNEGGDRDKLGRGWIWNGEINRCIHQNHVFKARIFLPEIQPRYISHYCNTMGDSYFQNQGKQTTNLASVSLSKVRAIPLSLPPATEQLRILEEVDRRFSVLDQIESAVNFNLRRCGQLRQAVLKRAFRE